MSNSDPDNNLLALEDVFCQDMAFSPEEVSSWNLKSGDSRIIVLSSGDDTEHFIVDILPSPNSYTAIYYEL
jgi:hypothetical protein